MGKLIGFPQIDDYVERRNNGVLGMTDAVLTAFLDSGCFSEEEIAEAKESLGKLFIKWWDERYR